MMALTLSMTIDFAFMMRQTNPENSIATDIPTVQAAEQEGCCLDTGVNQCVPTTKTQCPGKFYTGYPFDCSNVPECTPKTCIPNETSQACIRSKTVAECNAIHGTALSEDLETIEQCQTGCCIIAKGMKAEVLQKRQCQQLSLDLTKSLDEMQFLPDIKSQVECKKAGSPTDIVCCVLGGGNCKYGYREECTNESGKAIPLQGGEYCRDVKECAVTSQAKQGCGTRTGTEFNIYWFDSQGNQEEPVADCGYPEKICKIDAKNQSPYCADTMCYFDNLEQQVMTNEPPKVTTEKIESKLLTGTSQCYNFYTHYGVQDMYGKSTGLQNEILHCTLGVTEIQGLGPDRNLLCKNGNTTDPQDLLHANEFNNSWQRCSSCGKGGIPVVQQIGNIVGPFPPLGGMIANAVTTSCDRNTCENALGECVYMNKFPGGSNTNWFFIKSVVSCFPKYTPGTNSMGTNTTYCSQCYGGIDDVWSLCKEQQCEGLGDCEFKHFYKNGWIGTLMTILLLWTSYSVGRFVWMPVDCLIYTIPGMGAPAGTKFGDSAEYNKCFKQVRPKNFYFLMFKWPYDLYKLIQKNPVLGAIIGGGTALTLGGILKSAIGSYSAPTQ